MEQTTQKILCIIAKHGNEPVTHTVVLRNSHILALEANKQILYLLEQDLIIGFKTERTISYQLTESGKALIPTFMTESIDIKQKIERLLQNANQK